MKRKCGGCEMEMGMEIDCKNCGEKAAFLQVPKLKRINQMTVFLDDVMIHNKSKNEYQIKEIQKNGLIAKMTFGLLTQVVKKLYYISNEKMSEYKIKENLF